MQRPPSTDRGAAAVELALVLPVLLMIIFGIIDFGRMLNAQVTLTEAAREGARAQVLGQSAPDRVTAATLGMSAVSTAVTACAGADTDAVVVVTHTFSFVTPFGSIARMFGNGPGDTVVLNGRGVMSCA